MVGFKDREDAGRQLARALAPLRAEEPLVLALPRGGVVVGYQVAQALGAPLDVIVVRKLGAPFNPELGIGAIAPDGVRVLDDRTVELLGLSKAQLAAPEERERSEMERRIRRYRGDRPPPPVEGRTVVLVDDGLATGVSLRAAILALRRQGAGKIVVAVPVGAPETVERLRPEVDDLVCLLAPLGFEAVGEWYDRFDQTSDEEVVELLKRAWEEQGTGKVASPPAPHGARGPTEGP